MSVSYDDDWPYFPQQFGIGSLHDMDSEWPAPRRLAGLRSVKNSLGGVLRVKPDAPRPTAIGFHSAPVRRS